MIKIRCKVNIFKSNFIFNNESIYFGMVLKAENFILKSNKNNINKINSN